MRWVGVAPSSPEDMVTKSFSDANYKLSAGSYPNVPVPTRGRYLHPGGGQASHAAVGLNVLYLRKMLVPASLTFDRISCEITVTGAGSAVRLGIYNCDANGFPSTRVIDAGTVDASTSGVKEIAINQALAAGVYCVCAVAQGAGCNIRTQVGVVNYFTSPGLNWEQMRGDGFSSAIASVPGALPVNVQTDITWGVVPGNIAPLMMLRAA